MPKGCHWSHHEDLLLVECITETIGKGANIMEAFPLATERLNGRTEKACYNRWHTHLRKHFSNAILLAQRKAPQYANRVVEELLNKDMPATVSTTSTDVEILSKSMETAKEITIDEVISFVEGMKEKVEQYDKLDQDATELLVEYEKTLTENKELKNEIQTLKSKVVEFEKFQTLIDKIKGVTV